jgi:hypothetical protein
VDRQITKPHHDELRYTRRGAERPDPGQARSQLAVGVIGGAAQQPVTCEIGQPRPGGIEADVKPDLGTDEHRSTTPDPTPGPQGA